MSARKDRKGQSGTHSAPTETGTPVTGGGLPPLHSFPHFRGVNWQITDGANHYRGDHRTGPDVGSQGNTKKARGRSKY